MFAKLIFRSRVSLSSEGRDLLMTEKCQENECVSMRACLYVKTDKLKVITDAVY